MLELLIAGTVVTALVVASARSIDRSGTEAAVALQVPEQTIPQPPVDDYPDLPCPWCHARTREDDRSCPSCGQRFG